MAIYRPHSLACALCAYETKGFRDRWRLEGIGGIRRLAALSPYMETREVAVAKSERWQTWSTLRLHIPLATNEREMRVSAGRLGGLPTE